MNSVIKKRIVVVLGMHRSGTSVLARGLQAFGVSIGNNLLDSNEWNPKGYFEHADIVDLNNTLLGRVGKRWDSLALPPWEILHPQFELYREQALALLERDFAAEAVCGMKDPRASRLLPFWQPVFEGAGMQDGYVISLRHPISVARSLSARNGFKPEKSYLLWLSHVCAAIKNTQGKVRVVVDYDALITDPGVQLARIAAALDLPVTAGTQQAIAEYADGFLSHSLRHSVHDSIAVRDDPRIAELVGKAYDLLRDLAEDVVTTPKARQTFDQEWCALEQVLHDIAPVFDYLDTCEDRIEALTLCASTEVPVSLKPQTAAMAPQPPVPPAPLRKVQTNLRVSVVIPLFNHEQYIESTIQSVLGQTVRPAEIIVVDDGSSDGSAARMRQLCKAHPEIIFWSWPNQGAHHTLNAAIYRASGDFVAILNSDDSYDPERLSACLAIVDADPTVDVVATGLSFMDAGGRSVINAWYEDARAFFKQEDDLTLGLLHANFLVTTSNLFIRRSVFESAGYFSPLRYTHDLEFFLRLILAKKHIHFLDRPLLAYRWHGENTILENRARVDVELAAIFAFFIYRQRLADGAGDEWHSRLERYVHIVGQQKLLDMVEYFLAVLDGKLKQGNKVAVEPLSVDFQRILSQLGVAWAAQGMGDPLLAQFVAARNIFLRRWGHASEDSKIVAAFAEGKVWLESQRSAWEHLALEREQTINQLLSQLHEFEEGNIWLESQRLAWQKVASEREQSIAELNSRLNDLMEDKVWLESQRLAWEKVASEREQSIAELSSRLVEGNAWLESQRLAWEKVALEREQSIAELAAQLQAVAESNAWLESQRLAWENVASEREQSINELTSRLHEFTKRLAANDAVLGRIRSHQGVRLVNFLSKNKFLTMP